MIQKSKTLLLVVGFFMMLAIFSFAPMANAAIPCGSADQNCNNTPTTGGSSTSTSSNSSSSSPIGNGCNGKTAKDCLQNDPIVKDLNTVIDVLSGAIGIIVVGVIILGGIQYSMAGGKPNATEAAKKRIANGLIALVAFLFTFAFLQWLIPGGL